MIEPHKVTLYTVEVFWNMSCTSLCIYVFVQKKMKDLRFLVHVFLRNKGVTIENTFKSWPLMNVRIKRVSKRALYEYIMSKIECNFYKVIYVMCHCFKFIAVFQEKVFDKHNVPFLFSTFSLTWNIVRLVKPSWRPQWYTF